MSPHVEFPEPADTQHLGRQASLIARRIGEAPASRHERILSTIPCVLYDYMRWADGRSRFFFISQRCVEIFGHDAESIMNDDTLLWRMVHPEDIERLRDEDRKASAGGDAFNSEVRIILASGEIKWIQLSSRAGPMSLAGRRMWSGVILDITERKRIEIERDQLFRELQAALAEVKVLSGFLPICSSCKKIRDDKGYWNQLESYISEHSEAQFTHGVCPECAGKMLADFREAMAAEKLSCTCYGPAAG